MPNPSPLEQWLQTDALPRAEERTGMGQTPTQVRDWLVGHYPGLDVYTAAAIANIAEMALDAGRLGNELPAGTQLSESRVPVLPDLAAGEYQVVVVITVDIPSLGKSYTGVERVPVLGPIYAQDLAGILSLLAEDVARRYGVQVEDVQLSGRFTAIYRGE